MPLKVCSAIIHVSEMRIIYYTIGEKVKYVSIMSKSHCYIHYFVKCITVFAPSQHTLTQVSVAGGEEAHTETVSMVMGSAAEVLIAWWSPIFVCFSLVSVLYTWYQITFTLKRYIHVLNEAFTC